MPFEAPHTPDSSGPEGQDHADTQAGRASVPEETTRVPRVTQTGFAARTAFSAPADAEGRPSYVTQ